MKKEVNYFINKHALFHQHATVLVGVSGGPDSMALLHFLHSMKQEWDFRLIALSVDHELRGEQSKQDVEYVREICNQWDIEFYGTSIDVPSYKKNEGKSTELAARELRYQCFEEQMEFHDADYIALGHHGDDQAETMIMRLVRGANPSSLTGIPLKRKFANGYLVRPFLCITKAMIESYCVENQIEPRRDPTNEDDEYTRNYFRIHILPLLQKQNPSLHKNLQRLSESMLSDKVYLNQKAEQLVKKVVEYSNTSKEAIFDLNLFIQYPFALQRRAFHLILNYLYRTLPNGLYYGHEDQFFDLIHSEKANISVDFPMGLKMSKSYQMIRFHFNRPSPGDFFEYLTVPGSVLLLDGSKITATLTTTPMENTKNVMTFAVDERNVAPLIIRNRRPGDKMRIKGLNGSKKVKDIFIDEKIPLYLRDSWPIVVDQQGNMIWLVGLKKGTVDDYSNSQNFLQLYLTKDNM